MAIIPRPNAGPQDKTGELIRAISRGVNGGQNGPVYKAASFVAPAYGANAVDPDADAWWACDATAGAIVVTAPVAANTPLGTVQKISKVDAGGNTVTFTAADATTSNGTTSGTAAAGTTKTFVLANLNGTLTWVIQ